MKDGIRLAVTLFKPKFEPGNEKFPALLEYLPYRKDDEMSIRDYDLHSYFARRGYVSACVDIRGTGSSEGVVPEREYSDQEQMDGLEVIHWLASQDWSSGKVGMFGISWGGFNAIQLAMRRPPQLKAIIAVDASDKLFHDDIHYIDGMMHVDEFSLSMDLETAISPPPDFPTDEQTLQKRFDQTPWFMKYLQHQRDGEFWQSISLSSHYDSIAIPVFMIGGLLDGYRDSIPRMLENMKVPKKAIIGPWNHSYPHLSAIGPAIEWRKEAIRWWDHWLKDISTGITEEPPVTVYLRDWYKPELTTTQIPGSWVDLSAWPPPSQTSQTFYLGSQHQLSNTTSEPDIHKLDYVPSAGMEAGFWWGDLTPDQAPTDRAALVYDSEPLQESLSIVGLPKVKLWVSTSAKQADWMVRLSDISPDGQVALITGAGVNGAQRQSADHPTDLEPGQVYPIELDLHFTSWRVPVGHKIRVAITNALWPMIFPTPDKMTTSLAVGRDTPSRLLLPLLPADFTVHSEFSKPEEFQTMPQVKTKGNDWPGSWEVRKEPLSGAITLIWNGSDSTEFPWGTQANLEHLRYFINDRTPESSSVSGFSQTEVKLPDRTLTWNVVLNFWSDKNNFFYQYKRALFKDGTLLREKDWNETVPRDHQ